MAEEQIRTPPSETEADHNPPLSLDNGDAPIVNSDGDTNEDSPGTDSPDGPLSPQAGTMTSLQRKLKSVEDLLQCPVCLDKYVEPKSLTCLHALCRKCIESMVEAERSKVGRTSGGHGDIMVTCPTCRQRSSIPGSDPRNLQDNFMVKNMLEALTCQDDDVAFESTLRPIASALPDLNTFSSSSGSLFVPLGQSTDKLLRFGRIDCGNCGDEKDVVDVCRDCNVRLCRLCSAVHRKQLVSRSHTVVALESLSLRDQRALCVRIPHCAIHANELQQFYCNTCEAMICRECALFEHRPHDYITVEKYAEEERPVLLSCIKKVQALSAHLPAHIEQVQRRAQILLEDSVSVKVQAVQHIEKHIAALQERKHLLLREALRQHENRMLGYQQEEEALMGHQAMAKELMMIYEEIDVTQSPWDQLALTAQFNQCIDGSEKMLRQCTTTHKTDLDSAELTFDDSMASDLALRWESGAIVGRGAGISKQDASRYVVHAPDVSHTSWTTKVYIVDTVPSNCGASLASLTMPGDTGDLFSATLTIQGRDVEEVPVIDQHNGTFLVQVNINEPCWAQIHVFCNGQEVRASPAVISILSVGHTLKMFGTRGDGDCQFRSPYDISVSDINNHLYVADTGNHRVVEMTENGVLVQTINYTGLDGRAMKPTAITVTQDGKVVVADYNHKSLLVFDSGKLLKVVQPPDTQERRSRGRESSSRVTRPLECYGLAVDSLGQVLATDYVERSILIFSSELDFQSTFNCSCQLSLDDSAASKEKPNPRGPLGIHVGLAGEQYDQYFVADFGFYRLTVLEPNGEVARLIGSRLTKESSDEEAIEEGLKRPWGIWAESKSGDLLVSDHTSNSLFVFSGSGNLTNKFPLPDDMAPRMNGPVGMAADKFGRVWVAEREAHRVRLL